MANGITQNLVPSEPHLIDLLNLLKKDIFINLNCHHVGTVATFDPLMQTADVNINYQKTFFQFNQLTGTYVSITASYPLLMQCPVICLGGGGGALTFPIQSGDECLVLFNDRDMDTWFSSGTTTSPNSTARLHNFSDGIVLVGLRSTPNILLNYDTTRTVLRNKLGTAGVGVGTSLIKIFNATTTLNTLLQSLVTDIQSIVTALNTVPLVAVTGAPGGPSPMNPAITALLSSASSSLSTLSTQISTLLE